MTAARWSPGRAQASIGNSNVGRIRILHLFDKPGAQRTPQKDQIHHRLAEPKRRSHRYRGSEHRHGHEKQVRTGSNPRRRWDEDNPQGPGPAHRIDGGPQILPRHHGASPELAQYELNPCAGVLKQNTLNHRPAIKQIWKKTSSHCSGR